MSAAAHCASGVSPVRSYARSAQIHEALVAYRSFVETRGEGDPDLVAEIALASLKAQCGSRDESARSACFSALRGLGVRAFDLLDELARRPDVVGDRAASTRYEMERRDGDPPRRLRDAAASDDRERRVAGMASLRGRRGRETLIGWLQSEDPQLRQAALYELARSHRHPRALAAVRQIALEDPNRVARLGAASTLGSYGADAAPTLAALFQQGDPSMRLAVASAWFAVDAEAAEVALREQLATGDVNSVNIECARVLASHHDEAAGAFLLRAMSAGRRELRAQAAVTSAMLAGSHADGLALALESPDPEVALRVAATLLRQPEHRARAAEVLRRLSASLDGFVAVRALATLAQRGDPSTLEPLRRALRAPDPSVRRMAVMAWPEALGGGTDCDPIAPLLLDPDRSVALLAAVEIILIAAR